MALTGWTANDYLSAGSVVETRPFMVTAWVYPTWTTDGPYTVWAAGKTGSSDDYRTLRLDHSDFDVDALERTTFTNLAVAAGGVTGSAWNAVAAGFITSTLREAYAGTTRGENTTNRTPAAADAMFIGRRTHAGSDIWPSGDAIAEIAFWDPTGFTQANREALQAKIDAGENPLAIDAESGQPWTGALVHYWTLEDKTDGLLDQKGSNDLTEQGTGLSVFASHPPIDSLAPDPATLSRETADIAAQEQTDTVAHVRIDSVDTTAGNTHALYGHTSDLGSDPATWEASATQIDASVTTNDLVAWTGRTPDTTYFYAVVSTDSGGGKTLSSVLSFGTAHARPTSPTIVSKTADTVTVSWTDASSGAASHQLFYRESAQALSALQHVGTVPAGETIEWTFTNLAASTEYSFEALAWNGSGRFSGLTAITETPVGAVPVSPDTPTITAGTPGGTTCPLTSSAFNDANNDGHAASQWQVTTAADTGFASPVFDSGEDIQHLEAITATGLSVSTGYICRVRHKDDSGDAGTEWSAWSAADSFTTAAEPVNWETGIFPDIMTPVAPGDPDDPAERAEAGLLATDRATHVRVKIEDDDGTMQDVGDLANEDLLDGLTIEASTDQLISRATLSLWRAVGAKSLAPLMEGSVINRDALGAYAPLINPNRAITVEVATLEQGTTLESTDWALIFDGLVDEVDWGREVITVHARDKTAQLNDTLIDTVSTYGNDDGSENIDTVMQEILDAEFGLGVWPLAVIGSPTLPIAEYELGNVSVLEALKALADLIGWNLHYRWNRAAQAFRLTLWEPDRANIEPFWTFGADDYYDVASVALGLEGIRNKGEVVYTDVNGDQQIVSDTRAVSVGIYGERFIRLDAQGSSIVTQAQANNLLKAMLDDLEDPKVNQVIEAAFFWPIDLGDVHTYTANGVHYDTNQTWACFAYTHEIKPTRLRTSISAAGKPSGGFRRWHGKESASDRSRQIAADVPMAPWVQADFERDAQSETATLTLTVRDPQGSIDAVEFSLREGSQAGDVFTAYSSAWDVSPTAPPYDGTYSVSVSVPGGEESAVRWRVSFTDAAGTSRTIGSTHSTSQIDEHEVERLYMVAAGKASLVGPFDIDSTGAAHPETADGQTAIWVPVLLPEGVEITGAAIRAFQNDSAGGDVAGAAFRRMGDATATLLGNVNGFANGWNTYSNASLAEVVSAIDSYMFQVTLQNFATGGSATDARARWVSVTYIKHTQVEGV